MRKSSSAQIIPALQARTHFGEVMKKAHTGQTRFLVEKSGIPMVAIIPAEEYQRWFDEREVRFQVLDRIQAKLPSLSEETVQEDVAAAIRSARRKRHVQGRS